MIRLAEMLIDATRWAWHTSIKGKLVYLLYAVGIALLVTVLVGVFESIRRAVLQWLYW